MTGLEYLDQRGPEKLSRAQPWRSGRKLRAQEKKLGVWGPQALGRSGAQGPRSLNPISTSGGLLCLAGQAVVVIAHALFNDGEVRAVLPPVRVADPGGWPHPQRSNFPACGWACRVQKALGQGSWVVGAGGNLREDDSGVALWHERTDI